MAKKAPSGPAPPVLRKLGINETYQPAMYQLDQYRGTTVSCRYEIPPHLAAAESRAQLEEAVKVAVTPSWVQLPSLDLTQHIKWLYLPEHDRFENKVQEIFCAQLDDRFPDVAIRQPDWTLTIIRQGNAPAIEVLLTWNHPRFDAMGAKVIHEDLLERLNALNNGPHERTGLDGDVLTLPPTAPVLPTPLEGLKRLPVDLKYLIKAFWEETRPEFLNRDVSWAVWCPVRPSPYKTQFRTFFIDNASLLAIQALCRQNQTTITGLINGLALIAFSSRLDVAAAPAFQSSTVVDHRRNLPPAPQPDAPWGRSDRAVSNYVTQCLHKWDTALVARGGRDLSADLQRELWALSAQNRREIVDRLEAGLRNDVVGLFQYVTDWKQTMRGMANRTRQFSWLVTNIGVLDGGNASTTTTTAGGGDDGQKWSIGRAQFGLSTEVPAAAIEFSPVSVAGRGMSVSASWADVAVDVAMGEGIMADLERWLGQLAR
ncbi:hypothetical protein B0J18DRAFT_451342 [Chaetomium sp. MPI-SDFR-AT-0129]|nr:hypothetical protein B0J18DRAFT_451342 [Chaetomium sp. MPI-SDFR-AT-0129]